MNGVSLIIKFIDGTTETWSYVSSVDRDDNVLVVRPEAHSDRVIRFPLAYIKSWETDR